MQSKRLFAVAAVVGIVSGIVSSSPYLSLAEADPDTHASEVPFDIPAQPLATALERFMTATKVAIIVDSTVIAGRTSATVQGSFSPGGALGALLAGTGLDRRPIGSGAYTLVPLPDMAGSRPPSRFVDYAAAIQRAVTAALCQRDETRPTHYRMVMRLWLSPSGAVMRVELANTTGNPNLDLAIGDALEHVNVGAPAPSDLPQPVKLAIVPHTASQPACSSDEAGNRPASDFGR
jgi:hypothetical protein